MRNLLVICFLTYGLLGLTQNKVSVRVDLRKIQNQSLSADYTGLIEFLKTGISSKKLTPLYYNEDKLLDPGMVRDFNAFNPNDTVGLTDPEVIEFMLPIPPEELLFIQLYILVIDGQLRDNTFTPEVLNVMVPAEYSDTTEDIQGFGLAWNDVIQYIAQYYPQESFRIQRHPFLWRKGTLLTKGNYIIDLHIDNYLQQSNLLRDGKSLDRLISDTISNFWISGIEYWGVNYTKDKVSVELVDTDAWNKVQGDYSISFSSSYHDSLSTDIVPLYYALDNFLFEYDILDSSGFEFVSPVLKQELVERNFYTNSLSLMDLKVKSNKFLRKKKYAFNHELIELVRNGKINPICNNCTDKHRIISKELFDSFLLKPDPVSANNRGSFEYSIDTTLLSEDEPSKNEYLKDSDFYLLHIKDEVSFDQNGNILSIDVKYVSMVLPAEFDYAGAQRPMGDFDFEELLRVAKHEGKKNLYQGLIKLQEGKGLRWIEQTSRPFIK